MLGRVKREKRSRNSSRETHELIASDKVEGTDVYRSNGYRIGYIERIMIDECSGKAYAVMNFGRFIGIGEDSYPLPWQFKGAPKYRRHDTWWEKSDADRDSAFWG